MMKKGVMKKGVMENESSQMSFQNKGELEKAAYRLTAATFPFVRSGCSPAEPDYLNHNHVAPSDQAWTCVWNGCFRKRKLTR
jgi:hypothetical protein